MPPHVPTPAFMRYLRPHYPEIVFLVAALLLLALYGLPTAGCAHVVARDRGTFTAETLAALKRQEEAAVAMRHAAEAALARGDRAGCVDLAGPLLLIEAAASIQAHRALFLAGVEAVDPGPAPAPAPVESLCGPGPTILR